MTTAQAGLTVDQYVESMRQWVLSLISKTVRAHRGRAGFVREDLIQEANLTLVEVYQRFAGSVPEVELRKLGTCAAWRHVGNLHYRAMAKSRGGGVLTDSIDRIFSAENGGPGSTGRLNRMDLHRVHGVGGAGISAEIAYPSQLDGVILTQELERLMAESDEARAVLTARLDVQDTVVASPPDDPIFRRVQKRVRALLDHDGYRSVENPKEDDMDGIESPDVMVADPPESKSVAKRKAAQKKAEKPKAAKASARPSADATKSAAAKFKKGLTAVYNGGAKAEWLKKGTKLDVLGTAVSRGRTYVRCSTTGDKKVTLSPSHLGLL